MKRLLAFVTLLTVLLPASSWAATYVRSAICTAVGTGTTYTCTIDTTGGNVIVVSAVGFGGGAAISGITITDDQSGTYVQKTFQSAGYGAGIYVGSINTPGSTIVTATYTYTVTPTRYGICALVYSGGDTASTTDVQDEQFQSNPTTTTDAVTSTAQTTTADNQVIVGAFWFVNSLLQAFTAGTGFTQRENVTTADLPHGMCEDLTQSTAGSIAATATSDNGTADTQSFMVALKNAGVGVLRSSTRMIPGIGN